MNFEYRRRLKGFGRNTRPLPKVIDDDGSIEGLERTLTFRAEVSHLSNVKLDRLDAYLDTMPLEIIPVFYRSLFKKEVIRLCTGF